MDEHRIVSLFSGAGLMDSGFEQAGCTIAAAVEYDKQAVETWKRNRPGREDRIICQDIRTVTPEQLGVVPDELWAIIGGPPCQGFSVANSTRAHANGQTAAWKDDPRNTLFQEFLRLVIALHPERFVMENVKAMYTTGAANLGEPGLIMREVLDDFTGAGYRVQAQVLDAADYGVPQHRERVFVIGIRADLPDPILYPIQTHGAPGSGYLPWRTVRQAIGDLPEPGASHANHADFNRERIKENGHIGHRELDMDAPSYTVTAGRTDTGHGILAPVLPANHNDYCPADSNQGMESGHRPLRVDEPAPTVAAHHTNQPVHPGPMNHEPTHDDGKQLWKPWRSSEQRTGPQGALAADSRLSKPGNHHNPHEAQTIPRRLTPRECARLQSVPDGYFFCGSKSAAYRQIGNGVPVELARRIAAVLIGSEPGKEVKAYAPQLTWSF
ncbi:MAG TPA: DNA cytosine methyltransferase [Symbiobacteriaceae bacterium]